MSNNNWIQFVKQYQQENGLTWAKALTVCSPLWKKPGVKEKFIAHKNGVATEADTPKKKKTELVSDDEEEEEVKPVKSKTKRSVKGKEPESEWEAEARKYREKYYGLKIAGKKKVVVKKKLNLATKKKAQASDSESE
jgi:hypothetical protein